MKQALRYSLKVWLTTIGLAYLALIAIFVRHVITKPAIHQGVDEADPYFASIIFLIFNLFFFPAWGVFVYFVQIVVRKIKVKFQRITLNFVGVLLVILTFSPLIFSDDADEIYHPMAGAYLIFVSVSFWLYKLNGFNTNEIETTVANQ